MYQKFQWEKIILKAVEGYPPQFLYFSVPQVFDSIGKFLFEFGSYGSNEGEFDCPAGVSVNRIGQFIVSDRYNHRVQLFDPTGRFLRAFGCEGRTDGRFNYPWGIATDSLGFIYVCDKENHRIQVRIFVFNFKLNYISI